MHLDNSVETVLKSQETMKILLFFYSQDINKYPRKKVRTEQNSKKQLGILCSCVYIYNKPC